MSVVLHFVVDIFDPHPKIVKDELFDCFIYEFLFIIVFLITLTLKVFDNFSKL